MVVRDLISRIKSRSSLRSFVVTLELVLIFVNDEDVLSMLS
mgnify:CR=1 FL=1